MDVFFEALRRLEAGRPAALITVVRAVGSTPRHPGAHMLVGLEGECTGTIGGGAVEKDLTDLAARVARGELPAQRVTRHLTRDLAMCCGGSMEFWIEPLEGKSEALSRVVRRYGENLSTLLVTDLATGAKEVRDWDGGGQSALDGEQFLERLIARPRAIIFGHGHVSRALGPVARSVGFEIVICDDNETRKLDTDPQWADHAVRSFDLRDVERAVGRLGARDYVLILTRDHGEDERILGQLLPRSADLGYLGLIGSQGKILRFRKRLFAKGLATEDSWSRLHAPIGLDIHAETPEEIAVSVVAQLIALRNAPEGSA